MKVYIVGITYDDFGEGGFSILYISKDKKDAIKFMNDVHYKDVAVREYEVGKVIDNYDTTNNQIVKECKKWKIYQKKGLSKLLMI